MRACCVAFGRVRGDSIGSKRILLRGHVAHDVRVTGVSDGQARHAEVLSASSSEVDVVAGVVVHAGLGKHGLREREQGRERAAEEQ